MSPRAAGPNGGAACEMAGTTGRRGRAALVTAVVIAAAGLRLPGLEAVPPPLNQDEASRGFDAWCLWRDGVDRHGRAWPFFLESFGPGDYTGALSTYLTLPFVAILGPTALAMRLPDAVLGVATVALLYRLVSGGGGRGVAACAAAAVLAADPWHVALCRTAHESGFAPFFLTAGLVALHRSGLLGLVPSGEGGWNGGACRRSAGWAVAGGMLLAGLAWVYPATRLFTPLFCAVAVVIFGKEYAWRWQDRSGRRMILAAGLGLAVGGLPIWWTALTEPGRLMARAGVTLVDGSGSGLVGVIRAVAGNYLANLDPRYVFLGCDEMSGAPIPGVGLHLPVTAPLLVAGLWEVVRRRREGAARLLLAWMLLAPLPAAVCKDWSPHPMRTVAGMPVFAIVCGLGARLWIEWWSRRGPSARWWIGVAAGIAVAANVGWFVRQYFSVFPGVAEPGYQTSLVRAMEYCARHRGDREFVLVTNWSNQPYIYAALEERITPEDLRRDPPVMAEGPAGFHQVLRLGRYYFTPGAQDRFPVAQRRFEEVWQDVPAGAEGLVVERAGRFPAGEVVATFVAGDGKMAEQNCEVRVWRKGEAPASSPGG